MTKLVIHLEPYANKFLYFPGHLLKGYIQLTLDHAKKLRGCYMTVHGQAQTHWKESDSPGKSSNDVSYEGLEVYLNTKTYLFGNHDAEASEIEAGIYKFNFSCQLPPNVPYSMHASYGEINYFIKAVLDIPWATDEEALCQFVVAQNYDLNLYPQLKLPINLRKTKTFLLGMSPLMVAVHLPCSGFAAGQIIPIGIKYENRSNVSVNKMEITLNRLITFTSQKPYTKCKYEKETINRSVCNGVKAKNSEEYNVEFEIPKLTLNSNGHCCQVIRVEYFLKFEAFCGIFHSNVKLETPIEIGSIPINTIQDTIEQNLITIEIQELPVNMLTPTAPPAKKVPSAPSEEINYKNDDFLPSFEEATNNVLYEYQNEKT